jgi:hypothetical protein
MQNNNQGDGPALFKNLEEAQLLRDQLAELAQAEHLAGHLLAAGPQQDQGQWQQQTYENQLLMEAVNQSPLKNAFEKHRSVSQVVSNQKVKSKQKFDSNPHAMDSSTPDKYMMDSNPSNLDQMSLINSLQLAPNMNTQKHLSHADSVFAKGKITIRRDSDNKFQLQRAPQSALGIYNHKILDDTATGPEG